MKVLYITTGTSDYQCGSLFHGLYNVLGEDLTHSCDYRMMYAQYTSKEDLLTFYGKGFTLWGLLPTDFNDRSDLEQKIRNRYFDLIIYGDIRRCQDYLSVVVETYPKQQIAFIDGADDQSLYSPIADVMLFKRELIFDCKTVFPISFAMPYEKICNPSSVIKTKTLADYLPNATYKYSYDSEEDYYKGYQESYFGATHKKAGWDCMRHYEILANYSLPYFTDLADCPTLTMTNFPKQLIIAGTRLASQSNIESDQYYELLDRAFEYTKKHLVTTSLAKYVLTTIKQHQI